MKTLLLSFALGVLWAQQQADLWPPLGLVFAGILGGLGLWRGPRGLRWLAALLWGWVWASAYGAWQLAEALPPALEGQDRLLYGRVASLPERLERGLRFVFELDEGVDAALPRRVALSWYYGDEDMAAGAMPVVHAGERWRLCARLKRPHGYANPGGLDVEAWLFERGIRATGSVRAGGCGLGSQRLAAAHWGVERLRERIRSRFESVLGNAPYGGILVALVVGDQRAIPAEQWRLFADTGITHLMSISGLHVTMIAGLGWWCLAGLWRQSTGLLLRWPAQTAGAVGGVLAAYGYCLLAGFAVPAQRTLYMVTLVCVAQVLGRQVSGLLVLCWALVLVLLLDPLAVLAAGFWLSFVAVALLFYAGGERLGPVPALRGAVRSQWAVTVGLLPVLLALFQQFSVVSPLANALAIPVVTFVVTPLALLGAVLPVPFIIQAAHGVLAYLMQAMAWLAAWPWATWQQHVLPLWAVALAFLGGLALLLPRGWPWRYWGLLAFLPLFSLPPVRPALGTWQMTVLDVGQGLAVHVQTPSSDYVFDTGPQFTAEADSGNRVLLPYLRAAGVRRVQGVLVSHQDKDHSGGALSVLAGVESGWLLSSLPTDHPIVGAAKVSQPCYAGQGWQVDGVSFEIVHPPLAYYQEAGHKSNDMSCVLRISTAYGSALLTADIEQNTEQALVARYGAALVSDVMLVPHHGSRTSSSPAFIEAVAPSVALVPVGYRNRFAHPRPEVLAAYQERGIAIHRTDLHGALTVSFSPAGITVQRRRAQAVRYWHAPMTVGDGL